MGRIDRKVMTICLGVIALAAMAAVLYFANAWWLSGVVTASLVAWLAGMLAAIYERPNRRPVLVSALAASFLYLLSSMGPWFSANVGPWLVTTRGLTALESEVFGRPTSAMFHAAYTQPSTASLQYLPGGSTVDVTGSGVVTSINLNTIMTVPMIAAVAGPSQMVLIGHWFVSWIVAGLGAWATAWMLRRRHAAKQPESLALPAAAAQWENAA